MRAIAENKLKNSFNGGPLSPATVLGTKAVDRITPGINWEGCSYQKVHSKLLSNNTYYQNMLGKFFGDDWQLTMRYEDLVERGGALGTSIYNPESTTLEENGYPQNGKVDMYLYPSNEFKGNLELTDLGRALVLMHEATHLYTYSTNSWAYSSTGEIPISEKRADLQEGLRAFASTEGIEVTENELELITYYGIIETPIGTNFVHSYAKKKDDFDFKNINFNDSNKTLGNYNKVLNSQTINQVLSTRISEFLITSGISGSISDVQEIVRFGIVGSAFGRRLLQTQNSKLSSLKSIIGVNQSVVDEYKTAAASHQIYNEISNVLKSNLPANMREDLKIIDNMICFGFFGSNEGIGYLVSKNAKTPKSTFGGENSNSSSIKTIHKDFLLEVHENKANLLYYAKQINNEIDSIIYK